MKAKMKILWRRSVERKVGQVLDESTLADPSFPSIDAEIQYHLNAGHATPLLSEPETAVLPVAETRSATLDGIIESEPEPEPEPEPVEDDAPTPRKKRAAKA